MDNIQILIDTTRESVIELYEKMNEIANEGNLAKAKRLYRQVQLIISELNQFYNEWSSAAIEAEYLRGFDLEDMDFSFIDTGELVADITDSNFISLHIETMDTLSTSLFESLSHATANVSLQVGRMAKDRFAEITKKQALKGVLKGDTRKDISKQTIEELTKDGFTSFTDKLGRRWQLDSYAEMNGRSTLREATVRGIENRAVQEGYDLLKVSEHGTTCERCAKVEGRVFSISGSNPDYPKWDNHIIKHTHPNCKHTVAIFQEKYYDGNVYHLRRKSFDQRDYRTDQQKNDYVASQEKKRKQRANRLQYFRYKARLGSNAPKSLSGFTQMKNANNNNFKNLKSDYSYVGKQIKN